MVLGLLPNRSSPHVELRFLQIVGVDKTIMARVYPVELRFHKTRPLLLGNLPVLVGVH
jgi:hypothetical protein